MAFIGVVELVLIAVVILLVAGCQGAAGMVKAFANDPANQCVTASTPYGTVAALRTNTPGARCTASGGQCTCESPAGR